MITEADIEASFAEEILGMIKNPQYNTNVATFCQENHLDRNILTSKKLFGMTNRTLFRVMLGIAQLKAYLLRRGVLHQREPHDSPSKPP